MKTLAELRTKWEKGLTIVATSDIGNNITQYRVVLKDGKGLYHVHRYVKMGEGDWGVATDHRGVTADVALVWALS